MGKTRCNCDASCGENRYHNVGDSECRFSSEEEYDAYWGRSFGEFSKPKTETKNDKPAWVAGAHALVEAESYKPTFSENENERQTSWGYWAVLEQGKGYKVKRLEIWPEKSISLQYHNHRDEWWTIVQGEGRLILGGSIINVKANQTFVVPKTKLHKITNTHLNQTLIAIEVQIGEITDESDIVRV